MPRFINSQTGVVVNVDDKTAEQLSKDWAPAKDEPKTTSRRKSD